MAQDVWDKVGVLGTLIGGVLVPVAIYLAGQHIAETDKETSRLATQAGHLTNLIEPLSSDAPKRQLIAIEVSNHLAKTGQLPLELLPTLIRLARESPHSEIALKAAATVVAAAAGNLEVRKAVSTAFTEVPPRLYFHVPREDLRRRAEEVAQSIQTALKESKLVVPGVELRSGPEKTELRYFKTSEKEEAIAIQSALTKIGLDAKIVDLSKRYESATDIRPRHFELWFGTDANPSTGTSPPVNKQR